MARIGSKPGKWLWGKGKSFSSGRDSAIYGLEGRQGSRACARDAIDSGILQFHGEVAAGTGKGVGGSSYVLDVIAAAGVERHGHVDFVVGAGGTLDGQFGDEAAAAGCGGAEASPVRRTRFRFRSSPWCLWSAGRPSNNTDSRWKTNRTGWCGGRCPHPPSYHRRSHIHICRAVIEIDIDWWSVAIPGPPDD